MRYLALIVATGLLLTACSSEDAATTSTSSTTSSSGAGGGGGDGGAGGSGGGDIIATQLEVLNGYSIDDFDNSAQVAGGFSKLVERHVCAIPGRDGDPSVLWLYVEHVEVLSNGDRDAYFTRVNEIRMVGDNPVSRAYKFDPSHALYTDAFTFNGPRDGCTQPEVLGAITDSDLIYRDGCDVTYVLDGEVFHASTAEGTCTFPGGYIQTSADVFAGGLDVQDLAVSGGQEIGDKFEFRTVTP